MASLYGAPVVPLFAVTSFLSAALLFVVQPMYAKLLLPSYGGASAVWNTCIFFFEFALLIGYAWAHVGRRLRRQRLGHLALAVVAGIVLPLHLPAWAPPPATQTTPIVHLVLALVVSVGLPFVILSATAPLLQDWFSRTEHPRANDPYFLYAAGNAGSLTGLLAYPLVIERASTLHVQRVTWSGCYVILVALLAVCALATRPHRQAPRVADPPAAAPTTVGWPRRLRWVALAALPSSLMLGTTTHMTTDIAAVPLLWVIPLALYLITFIVAFGVDLPCARSICLSALPALGLVVAVQLIRTTRTSFLELSVDLVVLTVAAFACHSTLAAGRPRVEHLTEFYLLISVGGMLGGAFNGLVAPLVFQRLLEYPLVMLLLVLTAFVLTAPRSRPSVRELLSWLAGFAVAAAAAAALLRATWNAVLLGLFIAAVVTALTLIARRAPVGIAALATGLLVVPLIPQAALLRTRTFYGVYRVLASSGQRTLMHGAVIHGAESTAPDGAEHPETYYTHAGPIGQLFHAYSGDARTSRVAVVGLGAGSLASYSHPGDSYTFYELDPEIVHIARDPRYFTFLKDARGDVRTVLGDGRLRLSTALPHEYGVIVLDAFSSDAVPVHLLTTDAMRLYLSKLQSDGLIVFHVTNRFLDLAPVLSAVAAATGMTGMVAHDRQSGGLDHRAPSIWVALAANATALDPLRGVGEWRPLPPTSASAWTDEYSNVFGALR